MRKIALFLLMASSVVTYSQSPTPSKDLITVNTVKPQKGQKMAFEAAYKIHVAKFHKSDEKISVYEIMTGPHAGTYHLIHKGRSYADFDKERSDANAHNLDLDKTFFPYLEATTNATYRFIDSCSWQPDVYAESFVVSESHMKDGLNQTDYRRELARNLKIQQKMGNPMMSNFSWVYWDKIWDGSDQVIINIQNRKDGFKSLERNFYGPPTPPVAGAPTFREMYSKEYGYDAWDARVKIQEGAVVKSETYLMKLRKDLSSL